MFSCEFYEISANIILRKTTLLAASEGSALVIDWVLIDFLKPSNIWCFVLCQAFFFDFSFNLTMFQRI